MAGKVNSRTSYFQLRRSCLFRARNASGPATARVTGPLKSADPTVGQATLKERTLLCTWQPLTRQSMWKTCQKYVPGACMNQVGNE